MCMDDAFADRSLSSFCVFLHMTAVTDIYSFFDCRCPVCLKECAMFCFFQPCRISIVVAFSLTRPSDAAASISQQMR